MRSNQILPIRFKLLTTPHVNGTQWRKNAANSSVLPFKKSCFRRNMLQFHIQTKITFNMCIWTSSSMHENSDPNHNNLIQFNQVVIPFQNLLNICCAEKKIICVFSAFEEEGMFFALEGRIMRRIEIILPLNHFYF